MPYEIVPGLPGMKAEIDRLAAGVKAGTLDKTDQKLAKKLFKAIAFLAQNPSHPSLQSHEIDPLTQRYNKGRRQGQKQDKVFQSYLENNTPAAGRIFWVYGPERAMITLIGLEPHPEDRKNNAYARVGLDRMPSVDELAKTRGAKGKG